MTLLLHFSKSPKNVIQYAHYGYVYTLLVVNRKLGHYSLSSVSDETDEFLVSGGGDGTVKFWAFQKSQELSSKFIPSILNPVFFNDLL